MQVLRWQNFEKIYCISWDTFRWTWVFLAVDHQITATFFNFSIFSALKIFTAYMMAYGYGLPKVMSSYYFR